MWEYLLLPVRLFLNNRSDFIVKLQAKSCLGVDFAFPLSQQEQQQQEQEEQEPSPKLSKPQPNLNTMFGFDMKKTWVFSVKLHFQT